LLRRCCASVSAAALRDPGSIYQVGLNWYLVTGVGFLLDFLAPGVGTTSISWNP